MHVHVSRHACVCCVLCSVCVWMCVFACVGVRLCLCLCAGFNAAERGGGNGWHVHTNESAMLWKVFFQVLVSNTFQLFVERKSIVHYAYVVCMYDMYAWIYEYVRMHLWTGINACGMRTYASACLCIRLRTSVSNTHANAHTHTHTHTHTQSYTHTHTYSTSTSGT